MNDFREFQKQYNDYLQHGLPYADDYICHFGILGMKWGIRRYQNPDGTLTEAGKVRYSKEQRKKFINDVNNYNKYKGFNTLGSENARDKLLNNEYVIEKAKSIKEVGLKRDKMLNKVGDTYVNEYKDFVGATNLIRNEHGIKNFNIKNYNKGVQKYYKIIDEYCKKQGWKNVQEKAKNQGLGNIDDLFDIVHHESKEWNDVYKQYKEVSTEYTNQVTALAEEMLKESGIKKPTQWQIRTTIYGLSHTYKKE